MSELFKKSKYLVVKKVNDEYDFVYHSLYINSRIIDHEILDKFQNIPEATKREYVDLLGEEAFQEFLELGFIVENESDERERLKINLIKREKELSSGKFFQRMHLSTTNKCNMNCEYCFCNQFDYSTDNSEKRFPDYKMTFEVADKAISEAIRVIKDNNNDSLSIEFFGGEPLLNYRMIIDILEKYKNGEDYEINLTYGCTTNGAYVEDELIPYLKKYNVRVAMSIDYIDYDKGTFRGEGKTSIKWNTIDNNITRLRKADVTVKFQSVLSAQTWDKYNYNLIDYAKKMGIKNVGIILSFDFEFYKQYSPEEIAQKVLDTNDYCMKQGVQLSGYWYISFLGLVNPDVWNTRKDWKTCPTIGRLLSIEPNGDVYSCKTTAKKMGNIDRFDDIFSNEN